MATPPLLRSGRRIVGWREWIALPELGKGRIKAKIDTGARTSALHAFDIDPFRKGGEPWIRFAVHPIQRNDAIVWSCAAPVVDQRFVTNSGGQREKRFVIRTTLRLGEDEWPIELTLTNRDQMGFRMLIGRNAMQRRLAVDPALSFRIGKPPKRKTSSRQRKDEEE